MGLKDGNGGSATGAARLTWVVAMLFAVLALAGGLTACGSDSSSGGTTSAAGGDESSGGSGELASFEKELEEAKTEPTKWEGPTEPVKGIKGVKAAAIACDYKLVGCVRTIDAIAEAGKTLGWSVKKLDGRSDPQVQTQEILSSIAEGVEVLFTDIDPKLYQQALKAAEQKGVVVINYSNGGSTPNPVIKPGPGQAWTDTDLTIDLRGIAKALANAIIVNGGGKAHVLGLQDSAYPSVVATTQGAMAEIEKCAECSGEVMELPSATLGTTGPEAVVSHLRTHSDVDYLFTSFGPQLAAVIPALQTAGMAEKVKGVSTLGDEQNLNYVNEGIVQFADIIFDLRYQGFAAVDQALRVLNEQDLIEPANENIPWFLVEADNNLPDVSAEWHAPFDYIAKYEELWGLK